MSVDPSGAASPKTEGGETVAAPAAEPTKKRFLNGWSAELEDLMADWADKAACMRWMHDRTAILYHQRDRAWSVPMVILSGVTASANFALNSLVGDNPTNQKQAQIGLGAASLITGIIQSLMNSWRQAALSEAHNIASISWGKFNRLLCVEMRLHPDDRTDAFVFLKMFRVELDRLIEQSPQVPDKIIEKFNKLFKNVDIVKPEITGILEHTMVYKDHGARLKRLAAEATVAIHYKKGVIKQIVEDSLEKKTRDVAIEEARRVATDMINRQKEVVAAAAGVAVDADRKAAAAKNPIRRASIIAIEKIKKERTNEIQTLNKAKANSVAELKARFAAAASVSSPIPIVVKPPTSPTQLPGTLEDVVIQIAEEPAAVAAVTAADTIESAAVSYPPEFVLDMSVSPPEEENAIPVEAEAMIRSGTDIELESGIPTNVFVTASNSLSVTPMNEEQAIEEGHLAGPVEEAVAAAEAAPAAPEDEDL